MRVRQNRACFSATRLTGAVLLALWLAMPGQAQRIEIASPPPPARESSERPAAPRDVPMSEHALHRLGQTHTSLDSTGRAVAFSPDGALLAIVEASGKLWLWNARTNTAVGAFDERAPSASAVLFSPDGKSLVTSSPTGEVRFWNVAERKLGQTARFRTMPVNAISFSGDGKLLALGGGMTHVSNRTKRIGVSIIDATTLKVVCEIDGYKSHVMDVAMSPDGKQVAVCGGGQEVVIFEAETGKRLQTASAPQICYSVAYTPDGKQLVAAFQMGEIAVIDPTSGKVTRRLNGQQSHVSTLRFSADGKRLASRSFDHSTVVWDFEKGEKLAEFRNSPQGGPFGSSLAISPQGDRIAATRRDNMIDLWSVEDGRRISSKIGHWGEVRKVVFSADGSKLASSGNDGEVRLWDVKLGMERWVAPGPMNSPATLVFDGQSLLAASGDHQQVALCTWNNDGEQTAERTIGQQGIRSLGFTHDARYLLGAAINQSVMRVDVRSGEVQSESAQLLTYPGGLAVSGDGRLLAVAEQGMVSLFDATSLAPRGRIETPGVGQGNAWLALSHGRHLLAATNNDRSIGVYEVVSGQHITDLAADDGRLTLRKTAFHPAHRTLLAVPGAKATVELWDIASGSKLLTLRGHELDVSCLAFSPDGSLLASGSVDSTIIVWRMPDLSSDKTPQPLTDADLDATWRDLAARSARAALQAQVRLGAHPSQACELLNQRIQPARVDQQQIAELIAQLDADAFTDREAAMDALAALGRLAVPALEAARDASPSPEAASRIERLIHEAADSAIRDAESLRLIRAVQVLEAIATPQARQLLRTLAGGARFAVLTEAARDALERLGEPLDESA